ncbi:DUF6708 domain-containing protein [Chromohalobacter israelensis]|uniref:DUF6708 domain-containing protein n=1 Tax=Chromohalobacter israelensis TaxID=141390 RepID=UPI00265C5C75|nr:DUF6708 domain-containing protein [Chromohalobacter salexigens]MDO0947005.1 hypothetical protein [Chromohalobacter salexigens]
MNFIGLGPYKWKYKTDRALTDEEKRNYLEKRKKTSEDVCDDLSVIRINGTYLELVDRWYADKGHAVVYGTFGAAPALAIALMSINAIPDVNGVAATSLIAIAILVMAVFFFAFLYLIHFEAFRKAHYPIRLNRKTRMVYAFKPNGSVIRASWDNLFICKDSHYVPLMGRRFYDIRAHILDEDGLTIRETFTLGYPYFGDEERLPPLWEYIRCYMEDNNGVKKNYETTKLCMPVGERREGLYFGIVRGFGIAAFSPFIAQPLMSPIWAVITWGRLIAMYTSRVPRWPEEIEAECQIDENDPYCKDWRDNDKFTFIEGPWPVIWFVIGSAIAITAIYLTVTSMANAM